MSLPTGYAENLNCNAQLAAEWNARNGAQPNKFTKDAAQSLNRTKTALDQIKVPFFLSGGTMLGWYRNCMPLPWGNSAHVGVMIDDLSKDIIPAMKAAGFSYQRSVGSKRAGLTYIFKIGELRQDIHFVYRNGNKFFIQFWNRGLAYRETVSAFETRSANVFGMEMQIPYPPKVYLTEKYGDFVTKRAKNWKGGDWDSQLATAKARGEQGAVLPSRRLDGTYRGEAVGTASGYGGP